METSSGMRRRISFTKTLRTLLLGVLLCAAVGAAGFLLGRSSENSRTQLDAVVLQNQLSGISELASVRYSYTNMAKFENKSEFYGVTIPFTTKQFILTYDGEIRAGIDLSAASVSLQENTVTVRLPAAKILSHDIDPESVEIFDERASLFNPFTVEDFTAFQADQRTAMEEKALSHGLLEEAQTQAETSVRALLSAALPEGYELVLRTAA